MSLTTRSRLGLGLLSGCGDQRVGIGHFNQATNRVVLTLERTQYRQRGCRQFLVVITYRLSLPHWVKRSLRSTVERSIALAASMRLGSLGR